jgi:hypothetical protein
VPIVPKKIIVGLTTQVPLTIIPDFEFSEYISTRLFNKMPKRKYTSKSRSSYKRYKGKSSTASRALSIAKQVKSMVNKTLENKQINSAIQNEDVPMGGYSQSGFFGVIQGTADGNAIGSAARVGNTVTLMRSQFHANFDVAQGAASETYNKIRYIIVQSKEGTQTLSLADVLLYSDYVQDGDLVFTSPYTTKSGTNKRYTVLCDKVFEVNKYNNASRRFNLIKRYGKSGKLVHWNGNSSSSPIDFKTTILAISDSTVGNHPTISCAIRHTYKDA